ncbi:MAG: tyrosine-type recombinase/integrase [Elusimicrobia bacterium]|nr:tyrosine-type recombinase/integrase [Elusimicrobiota bacterium]
MVWYEQIFRAFIRSLEAKSVTTLEEVGAVHLRQHLSELKRAGLSSETVFRVWAAQRCAFGFWHREGLLSKNPMEQVERPRRERVLIRPFTPEQVNKLLAAPDVKTTRGLRDRALMMLMMDSGLRVSEATSLEADRIDWLNCSVTVMGKGRKERTVPFSATTAQALLEYARARSQGRVQSPQIFLGRTGKPIERTLVRKLMVRYGKLAGIEGVRVSPHTLRHTFAVFYVRNGGDSFSLQEILGHSTLEMTRRYVHLARRDLSEQHKKFSPVQALAGRALADASRVML